MGLSINFLLFNFFLDFRFPETHLELIKEIYETLVQIKIVYGFVVFVLNHINDSSYFYNSVFH